MGLLGLLLHFHNMAGVVVLLADDDDFVHLHGHLKTILVFYENNVLTLEASHAAASHLAEKSYFISYFHILCGVMKE